MISNLLLENLIIMSSLENISEWELLRSIITDKLLNKYEINDDALYIEMLQSLNRLFEIHHQKSTLGIRPGTNYALRTQSYAPLDCVGICLHCLSNRLLYPIDCEQRDNSDLWLDAIILPLVSI